MTISQQPNAPVPRPSVLRQIREGVTHPAGIAFLALWLLAATTLVLRGHGEVLKGAPFTLGPETLLPILLLIWLVPRGPEADVPRHSRAALWGQVAFIVALILLNGLSGLRFHRVIPDGLEHIPVWTDLDLWLQRVGRRMFNNPGWVRNPVLYVLLPGAVLLLCRVRPAELGLSKGYRSWVAAAPYLLFVGIAAVVHIAMGDTRVYTALPRTVLSHFLQNGFSEEFLFRGALQSRLAPLIGEGWSLVVSSLLFGLVHLGTTTRSLGGDYLAGLAMTVVLQACAGLVFGLMFMRTRSLIAPTIAHITLNMISL